MALRSLAPQASASTNSATWAQVNYARTLNTPTIIERTKNTAAV